jgi:hypothetical protein
MPNATPFRFRLRSWGGTLIRKRMRSQAGRFLMQTNTCRDTQQDVLHRLLELNRGTDFSRDHGLDSVHTVAEFRQRVPVVDYEYHRPYIERLKRGERSALLGDRNRLLMFTLTSGTTAESKFIPITSQFLADYRRGWTIWGIRAYDDHPALHVQQIVQLTSDHDQFRTAGGTPCGNISGLVSAMQSAVVRTMYTVPGLVSKIKDPEAKYYTALRLSVPDRHVGMVTTANPSTLLQLARQADANCDDLIRDIADGTLSQKFTIDAEIRRKLRTRFRVRNPQRARELEAIVSDTGHLYPRHYWSNLSLIAVWTGGSAGAYTSGLRQFYGDVPIRDHGLHASEGRMTIPFEDHTSSGVLDLTSHFFEFIPDSEYGKADPVVLEAHELEPGRNYFILLTTASGLYRYNIHDVVRCTGYRGGTPMLEFLNKGSQISSVTGEKITESQVVSAVKDSLAATSLQLTHFTVGPAWGDPPGYQLLFEEHEMPAELRARICEAIDSRLSVLNCEYGEKRKTGRLGPLSPVAIPTGAWRRFARRRQSKLGGSIEQYKHPCLVPDLKFCEDFVREYCEPGTPMSRV